MPSTHPAARRRGPGADGFPGIAAICRAYGVNASLLGGGDADEAAATAEEAVELARRSGMPTAIVLTLNSLAMSLVERDPVRARAVLGESLVRTIGHGGRSLGRSPHGVHGGRSPSRLELTRTLVARSLYFDRWFMAPLQIAICLAECARAFADDRPEVAGALLGASYVAFQRAAPGPNNASATGSGSNFVLGHLHETADLVAAALGDQQMRELRTSGANMSMDDAVAHALANIDPKILRGPIPASTS